MGKVRRSQDWASLRKFYQDVVSLGNVCQNGTSRVKSGRSQWGIPAKICQGSGWGIPGKICQGSEYCVPGPSLSGVCQDGASLGQICQDGASHVKSVKGQDGESLRKVCQNGD